MAPKLFEDDDEDSSLNEDISKFEVDENYGRRLEYNRKRQDLQKYEEQKKKGAIVDDSDDSDESSEEFEPEDDFENPRKDLKFFDSLLKVRRQDPSLKNKDVKLFESDEEDGVDEKDDEGKKGEKDKKKKKMYLKDVQAKHLIEEGPDFDGHVKEGVKTYVEEQEELRKALRDAVEAAEADADEDDEDLLRVKESKGEDVEVDEEFVKKVDEYFGEDAELDEGTKFLRDFFTKQMWKERDEKGKKVVIHEAELNELDQDEDELERQEEYEIKFRHEEEDAGALKNYPRIVEDSVRNKENPRKAQRKSKEERMRIAEMERQEELKRLKNVKKKEIKEKMKKVLAIAGFKEGEECPINPKDLDDEFDPEEYDKMMKAVFDDKYYGKEDSDFGSDEDEKPNFEKEDELLGLPKNWDVIKPGDGFLAAREKTLKKKEDVIGDEDMDGEAEEEEGSDKEEEEEGKEQTEESTESKRKRKRKASLVQRAKEALMEEYYKLDYEDTVGDLKTRFKYAKVEPNGFGLKTKQILALGDKDLNQYVSLKKIAPYREEQWKLDKSKKRELKLKIKELLGKKKSSRKKDKGDKKGPQNDRDDEKKPTSDEKNQNVDEGEGRDDESKLSRKAKRRRRQSELKPSHSRLMSYQKARVSTN